LHGSPASGRYARRRRAARCRDGCRRRGHIGLADGTEEIRRSFVETDRCHGGACGEGHTYGRNTYLLTSVLLSCFAVGPGARRARILMNSIGITAHGVGGSNALSPPVRPRGRHPECGWLTAMLRGRPESRRPRILQWALALVLASIAIFIAFAAVRETTASAGCTPLEVNVRVWKDAGVDFKQGCSTAGQPPQVSPRTTEGPSTAAAERTRRRHSSRRMRDRTAHRCRSRSTAYGQ